MDPALNVLAGLSIATLGLFWFLVFTQLVRECRRHPQYRTLADLLRAKWSPSRWQIWREKFWREVAWHLPKMLVKWAAIRVLSHATTGRWGNTYPDTLPAMEALQRWSE